MISVTGLKVNTDGAPFEDLSSAPFENSFRNLSETIAFQIGDESKKQTLPGPPPTSASATRPANLQKGKDWPVITRIRLTEGGGGKGPEGPRQGTKGPEGPPAAKGPGDQGANRS